MHPAVLTKKLDSACRQIVEHAQQIAAATGQTFTPPESFLDLKQNQGAPLDVQLLVVAELTAAALALFAEAVGARV
jgi:protein-disulfide isomerase-like protein with CxxC motif